VFYSTLPIPPLYGLVVTLGIVVCILFVEKFSKLQKTWDVAFYGILGGMIGARLYHVLDLWSYYSINPVKILFIWQGGLGIWGGIFGAAAGIWLYCLLNRDRIWFWLDLTAISAPIGQAIGRLGNFINQENYGLPTTLPWGIYIDPANRLPGFENFSHFHPLFLYEAILLLFIFGFMLTLRKKLVPGSGKLICLYLAGYSVIRFFLEFLRINPWKIAGIPTAQIICAVVFVCCTIRLVCYTLRRTTAVSN
jgi:phosphatidylglycerol---prolipoprotein diacylglyceryl transferase